MFDALVVAAAIAASVNQPIPELQVHERAEARAALAASVRLEPLGGVLAIREGVSPGVWNRDAKTGARWTAEQPFELVYDAGAGVVRLSDGAGVVLHERHLAGLAAVDGPNLLQIEVANFDGRATARLERLAVRTGDLERPLRDFGRGTMSHDLATVWEPLLADGFRLTGVLRVVDPAAKSSGRVWVDFGLGRGRRVEVEFDGPGQIRSEPQRLVRTDAGKSAAAFFGLDENVRLLPAEGSDFQGWRIGDRLDVSHELAIGTGDEAVAVTAVFGGATAAVSAGGESPLGGGPFVFSNPAAITVPAGAPGTTQGPADPYPSTIVVGGPVGGAITDLDVKLDSVTHTFPDDFDVVVVNARGTAVLIMSDACGDTDVSDFDWTFDDEAAAPMTDATLDGCIPFFVQPTNYGGGDTFPVPGPTSFGSVMSALDTENPNGTWNLFVVDDASGDVGAIENGWSITVTTEPYVVLIPGTGTTGAGSPYPSVRSLLPNNTFFGAIVDAQITLVDMTHEHPDDLDVLIQGPTGAAAILMSDACGSTDILNYIWTFDDEAAAPMTDTDISGCNPFVVQPTNFGAGDVWPAPAPVGDFQPSLALFDGTNPFGNWNLWINDDAGADVGFLETDWSVDLVLTGLFRDGFETNDTCEWSSTAGGPPCP